jgi:hypothetical protein
LSEGHLVSRDAQVARVQDLAHARC